MVAQRLATILIGLSLVTVGSAQVPELPPQWFENRSPTTDEQQISFCVDEREPGHVVDAAIAAAIAEALLLQPRLHVVARTPAEEDGWDRLYLDLVDNCSVYLGFKLYSQTYPEWLTTTRPLYQGRFVLVTQNEGWNTLADIPLDVRIGAVQGTMGDIRFLTYNNALPAAQRRPRAPLGEPRLAMQALLDGVVGALIVWEPWWWWLQHEDPELSALHLVEAPLISEPWVDVGALSLADRSFVRSSIDIALAALTSDGTIQEILASFDFPGRVVP